MSKLVVLFPSLPLVRCVPVVDLARVGGRENRTALRAEIVLGGEHRPAVRTADIFGHSLAPPAVALWINVGGFFLKNRGRVVENTPLYFLKKGKATKPHQSPSSSTSELILESVE